MEKYENYHEHTVVKSFFSPFIGSKFSSVLEKRPLSKILQSAVLMQIFLEQLEPIERTLS